MDSETLEQSLNEIGDGLQNVLDACNSLLVISNGVNNLHTRLGALRKELDEIKQELER